MVISNHVVNTNNYNINNNKVFKNIQKNSYNQVISGSKLNKIKGSNSTNGINEILKRKKQQDEIIGKMQERQSENIDKLKNRFYDLMDEIDDYRKDQSKVLSKYEGQDTELDKILGGDIKSILNGMKIDNVSNKLNDLINGIDDGTQECKNNKEVLRELLDRYTNLYQAREDVKNYLTESQQKIDDMRKQLNVYMQKSVELDKLGLFDSYDKDKKKVRNDLCNSNEMKVKNNEEYNKSKDKSGLVKVDDQEEKVKEYKEFQDAVEKGLQSDIHSSRNKIKEASSKVLKNNKNNVEDGSDLKAILSGDLQEISEKKISINDIHDKLASIVSESNDENIVELYEAYDEYYKRKNKKDEFSASKKNEFEKYKENIENFDKEVFKKKNDKFIINYDDKYNNIEYSYNPDLYYELKEKVYELYR